MYVEMIHFDGMTGRLDFPPPLINQLPLKEVSIMTTEQLPLFYPESQAEKKCTMCGEVKPVNYFYKRNDKNDGLNPSCKDCSKEQNRRNYLKHCDERKLAQKVYYKKNSEQCRAYAKQYVNDNKVLLSAKSKEYYKNNKALINEQTLAYYEKNKESLQEKHKEYCKKPEVKAALNRRARYRYKHDIMFRLNTNIRNEMNRSLKGFRKGKRWEGLVGYTLKDLKKHIEKQFTEGMSWDKYLSAEIHIDHKIPLAVHNFKSHRDIDFHKAWDISNLQPLWAKDNFIKRAKIDKPFQPALAFG